MNRLRNTVGIYELYDFQELKPQPFLNTPIRSGIIHYETGLGLVIETLTGPVLSRRVKKAVQIRLPETWMLTNRQHNSRETVDHEGEISSATLRIEPTKHERDA